MGALSSGNPYMAYVRCCKEGKQLMIEFLNNPECLHQLKILGLKLVILLIITPFLGYTLLRVAENVEKKWKFGNRRTKWLLMCEIFLTLAIIGGWLR